MGPSSNSRGLRPGLDYPITMWPIDPGRASAGADDVERPSYAPWGDGPSGSERENPVPRLGTCYLGSCESSPGASYTRLWHRLADRKISVRSRLPWMHGFM